MSRLKVASAAVLAVCLAWAIARPRPTVRSAMSATVGPPEITRVLPRQEPLSPDNPDSPESDGVIGEALRRAQRDPREALRWCAGNLAPAESAPAIAAILHAWAERAPGDALVWIFENQPGIFENQPEGSVNIESDIIASWADHDPHAAAAWLAANIRQSTRQNLLALFGSWIDSDESAAVDWALKKISPKERQSILPELLATVRDRHSIRLLMENSGTEVANDSLAAARKGIPADDTDSPLLDDSLPPPAVGTDTPTLQQAPTADAITEQEPNPLLPEP